MTIAIAIVASLIDQWSVSYLHDHQNNGNPCSYGIDHIHSKRGFHLQKINVKSDINTTYKNSLNSVFNSVNWWVRCFDILSFRPCGLKRAYHRMYCGCRRIVYLFFYCFVFLMVPKCMKIKKIKTIVPLLHAVFTQITDGWSVPTETYKLTVEYQISCAPEAASN